MSSAARINGTSALVDRSLDRKSVNSFAQWLAPVTRRYLPHHYLFRHVDHLQESRLVIVLKSVNSPLWNQNISYHQSSSPEPVGFIDPWWSSTHNDTTWERRPRAEKKRNFGFPWFPGTISKYPTHPTPICAHYNMRVSQPTRRTFVAENQGPLMVRLPK